MRVITVYDDEREEIITYVSAYDMQGQSIKGKQRSNKAVKLSRLYTEHTNSYHETIQTRTFLCLNRHVLGHRQTSKSNVFTLHLQK